MKIHHLSIYTLTSINKSPSEYIRNVNNMVEITFHQKVAGFQCLLLLVAFVFQLLALITVPLTNLTMCEYQGYRFGVFGFCYNDSCTTNAIGYQVASMNSDFTGFTFPSNARHSLSYLLVVHPISAAFTGVQLVLTIFLFFQRFYCSQRYFVILMLGILPTFMLSLLSFLVDLMMFIPHLRWCGWTILGSTTLIALYSTTICTMRRTISSQATRVYTKNLADSRILLSTINGEIHTTSSLSVYSETGEENSYMEELSDGDNDNDVYSLAYPESAITTPQQNSSRSGITNPPRTLLISESDSD